MKRLKYLAYFLLSLAFAFLTFHSFFMFQGQATFSSPMMAANMVGFMVLWFLSYTAKSQSVHSNRIPVIIIPAVAIQMMNIQVNMSNLGTDSTGLTVYIISTSGLLYFSYKMSRIEKNL
jgi:hypothetical protein